MRALGFAVHCSAHLQMGVLTGIVAINADLEIGATKRDPRILQVAEGCAAGYVLNVVIRLTAKRAARMAGDQAPITAGRTSASPSLPKKATET